MAEVCVPAGILSLACCDCLKDITNSRQARIDELVNEYTGKPVSAGFPFFWRKRPRTQEEAYAMHSEEIASIRNVLYGNLKERVERLLTSAQLNIQLYGVDFPISVSDEQLVGIAGFLFNRIKSMQESKENDDAKVVN